ncbi:MAG: hypothetical protein LUH57_00660 [Ruminococcus sp.]|nr:hypothetical protein [Ruminococcus sp.]
MEKRKKLRPGLDRLLDSKRFIMILAIVIAIVLWLFMSITVYPDVEKKIAGIPLTVSFDDSATGEDTLIAQNSDSFSITANISGARYVIGDYTSDDLVASVSTAKVTKSGEYTLDVSVSSANGDSIDVLSVSPKTVTLSFDYTATKVVELTSDKVDTSSLTTADGYVKDVPVINPTTITIEGAKSIVDTISTVSVKVLDEAEDLTEAFTTSNTEIILYDEDSNVVSKDDLQITPENISVSVNVTQKASVPITINFTNSQGEVQNDIIDATSIISTISPQAINVSTTADSDESTERLTIELDLSLREAAPGKTVMIDKTAVKAALSAKGLTASDSDISDIYVTYKTDGLSSKEISLSESSIKLLNIPDDKDVSIVTETISNVVVYGPEDVIESLTSDDFVAVLDLSIAELSNDTFPVTVYCESYDTVWAYGDQTITLSITDKEEETTTTAEDE